MEFILPRDLLFLFWDALYIKLNKKFWEELIAYFLLTRHGPQLKTTPPTSLRCRGYVFTEQLPSNDRGEEHIQKQRLRGAIYEARR
jgi:hypothetical protein